VQNFTVDNEETQQQGYQRQMQWIGYTKINSTTLRYPNTAIAAFGFNTSGFSSIPTAAFKVFGMLIRIPSNATVTAQRGLTYSGTWNGSFIYSTLAVSDPAWILYDLLTNTRYGLGDYIDIGQIDKWGLYEISQYCNGLVPDGYGGTEHRFQCNIALQSKTEAYQVLQSLITIFRGFSYWQSGAITFVADKPTNVSYQFTQADVEEGLFTYARTGLKSKKTIALVSWLNPNDFYRKTVEVVEDPIGIQKWGIKELEVEAIACTSRGQARRAGVAILMGDRLEQETVIFKARAYAAFIKPGDVINILDSQRVEMRYGGLIKAATENTVTLDSPVTLISGESYKISVTLSNGTAVERTVVTGAGSDISTIVVSSNFPMIPLPESNWILSGTSVKPKKYRVINRVPVTETIEGMHEITAAEYDDSKYTFIDEMRMV
jgi:predicted phage tail protein